MYVALYRKYRPIKFEDVISQNHITTTLKNEIKLDKIAHAYMFTGPRGTGKTTCAKIFSKAINCKNKENGEPCCECEICRGIQDESILDITEMDGASNNSVSDVRILRDEANFVPTHCKYRVYIIDEVHMLSSSAFNALLKIMEEPPKYVVFILATTDIYKVPKTILSRCQRFDFKRIKPNEIMLKIKDIAEKEKIKITDEAAFKIALISQGSMRDAISIFDKCSIKDSEITKEILEEILGIVKKDYILSLHKAIKEKDKTKILEIIENIYYDGKNLEDVVEEILCFYREMLYFNILKEKSKEFLEYYEYIDEIKNVEPFNFEEINLILEEILGCTEKIKNSNNQKLLLELEFLKIIDILNPSNFLNKDLDLNIKQKKEVEINETNPKEETKKNETLKVTSKEKKLLEKKENIKEIENILEKLLKIAKDNDISIEEK